jgi:hypothetical protein
MHIQKCKKRDSEQVFVRLSKIINCHFLDEKEFIHIYIYCFDPLDIENDCPEDCNDENDVDKYPTNFMETHIQMCLFIFDRICDEYAVDSK